MSKIIDKKAMFLQAMNPAPEEPAAPAHRSEPRTAKAPQAAGRNGLKHIGGYFDRSDVERFAILRARLGLDNSQLIKLAIDELYKKHEAKKAFGDA
jgi:hypothetical protein